MNCHCIIISDLLGLLLLQRVRPQIKYRTMASTSVSNSSKNAPISHQIALDRPDRIIFNHPPVDKVERPVVLVYIHLNQLCAQTNVDQLMVRVN